MIIVGVLAAYSLSVVHTVKGAGSLYFDTAAMVLVIVTLGSYLEAGAKRRAAGSASRLLAILPRTVWRWTPTSPGSPNTGPAAGAEGQGHRVEETSADRAAVGDVLRVRPGEMIPVDGRVAEGRSRVSESTLTGESTPRDLDSGQRVLAGSLNLDGQIWVRAERVGTATVLAVMEQALEEARRQRPEIQRLADRVAAVFLPLVFLIALGTLVHGMAQGEGERGILTALSVLLISCPCALGLAAPLAGWYGLRRAARLGILVDGPATLERAAAVGRIFFDKTGTLTDPELSLRDVSWAPGVDPAQGLRWAASLETASLHPIARAIQQQALRAGLEVPSPRSARQEPGFGIQGQVDGRHLRLGSARWAKALGWKNHPLVTPVREEARSTVFLLAREGPLARFSLGERLREGAENAVRRLRGKGIAVEILSGDGTLPTDRIARRLRVPAQGGMLPRDKVERLRKERLRDPSDGRLIAMVGDGINDAPVLASADVGISLGSASDLARRSGQIRLTHDRLERIPLLLELARDVRRRIRLNLAWAFGFNSVGILLAILGWLTPVFAAAAMVASSLLVVRISSGAGRRCLAAKRSESSPQPGSTPRGSEGLFAGDLQTLEAEP